MTVDILSWNIFANITLLEKRTIEIAKKIMEEDVDVVCLQEVLYNTFLILNDVFKERYQSVYSNPYENNTSGRAYGEAIFVKKSRITVTDRFFTPLLSTQGRTATFVDVVIDDVRKLRISTAHLESATKSHETTRKIQIENIKTKLETTSDWLWIGDSNFEYISPYFIEHTTGPTWFGNRFFNNTMVADYDRVMTNQKIVNFRQIGNEQVDGMWLSDHNGIICTV